ncbi:hypothetical protein VIGAN_09123300, partial [Vigna angularis var. angularis]
QKAQGPFHFSDLENPRGSHILTHFQRTQRLEFLTTHSASVSVQTAGHRDGPPFNPKRHRRPGATRAAAKSFLFLFTRGKSSPSSPFLRAHTAASAKPATARHDPGRCQHRRSSSGSSPPRNPIPLFLFFSRARETVFSFVNRLSGELDHCAGQGSASVTGRCQRCLRSPRQRPLSFSASKERNPFPLLRTRGCHHQRGRTSPLLPTKPAAAQKFSSLPHTVILV